MPLKLIVRNAFAHPIRLVLTFLSVTLAVFLICLGEFAGAPIAAAPLLVLAGVIAPLTGGVFWVIPIVAAIGAFLGDLVWYLLANRHSPAVVDRACGLTSNPWACVIFTRRKLPDAGTPFYLLSHLIPGTGNLVASAAGLVGIPARRFLSLDAVRSYCGLPCGRAWDGWPPVGRAARCR